MNWKRPLPDEASKIAAWDRQRRQGRRRETDRGWQRAFDDPIQLPDGRTLVTLHDAATYITRLPKKEAAELEWQAANRGIDVGGRTGRPDDVCPDRHHESN